MKIQFIIRLFIYLLCLVTFAEVHITFAQELNGDSSDRDYGAETIELEDAQAKASVKALPLEQVEEPADEVVAAPKKKPDLKKTKPENDPESSESDEKIGDVEFVAPEDATTLLNVKDVEIAALVKSFSKITKRNYIIDSNVKGKVTIHLPTPVNIAEALKILDSVLLLKGFTTVPVEKNIWKVVLAKDARQTTIPTQADSISGGSDALVTQIVRLKHVQAQDMQQTMQQFVSKEGLLTPFAGTNSLIIIDSSANIERIVDLTKQLDVPALDQDITIIPILHADVKDVAEKINSIVGENKDQDKSGSSSLPRAFPPSFPNNAGMAGVPPPSGQPNASPANTGQQQRRSLPIKVIADERTNSLIVVADPELTVKIKAITEQLDSPLDRSGGRFYVIRLKHADAEEMSNVLNAVITGQGGSGGGSSSQSRSTGSSLSRSNRGGNNGSGDGSFGGGFGGGGGGFGSSNRSSRGNNNSNRSASPIAPIVFGGPNQGAGTPGRVNFEGEVTIAADPATNSLIVNASKQDFLRVKEVVDQLDVKRKQVLVEATIIEVSLEKTAQLGVNLQGTTGTDNAGIFGQSNFGGLSQLLSNPAGLTDVTIAALSTGTLKLGENVQVPSQAVVVRALSNNRNANVLSSPTILTTDNQEAEIVVGQNVPFITGTGSNEVNLNNTFNQIQRQDVGITLRITPQIGTGDFVTLKIFVEVSNVLAGSETSRLGPTTNIRTTETNVEVRSGQMIVTGGLIQDDATQSEQGVPFLQDIPILGMLFRQDGDNQTRRNLLMFITPRIITDQFLAREETVRKSNQLSNTIMEQGSEPDRKEILKSEQIDRALNEIELDNENPPSLITAPSISSGNMKSNPVQKTDPAKVETAHPDAVEEVVDVTVSPKLPVIPKNN
jgi:general secretion pathway protein D